MIYLNKNVKIIYRKMIIRKKRLFMVIFLFELYVLAPSSNPVKKTTLCMLNCIQRRDNSGGAASPQPTPQVGSCLDLQIGLAVNG